MSRILIEVSDLHIVKGSRQDCRSCPVALAVKQKVRPIWSKCGVLVRHHSIRIRVGRRAMFVKVPVKVTRFIERFDNWEKVRPIYFWLDLPGAIYTKEPK